MKKCQEIQNRILMESELSAEDLEHVRTCRDCALFRRFAEKTLAAAAVPDAELPEVPAALDEKILKTAHSRRKRVLTIRFAEFAFSAAAAAAICTGLVLYDFGGKNQTNQVNQAKQSGQTEPAVRVVQTQAAAEQDFEDELFLLASDVATGMSDVSETLDIVI